MEIVDERGLSKTQFFNNKIVTGFKIIFLFG